MVGYDVGGQNFLNLGADHLVFLCTLQTILCPVSESYAFGKRKEKKKRKCRKAKKCHHLFICLRGCLLYDYYILDLELSFYFFLSRKFSTANFSAAGVGTLPPLSILAM